MCSSVACDSNVFLSRVRLCVLTARRSCRQREFDQKSKHSRGCSGLALQLAHWAQHPRALQAHVMPPPQQHPDRQP